ncbi:hypothetical protein BJ878DRAFT_506113 [Calycina marina]|uniref:UBX domain-containing protein n=1 Tax=Calycina marina TaxID=1763456 RepID=A0A9P7Z364_9HELO|nr:hypothetical protein BJ878DRAFT_506113 [Calycina marina]
MSAHVVVISTSLKRAKVSVISGMHMTDILAEACKTLGARYSDYGFKHNNKTIDMSRRFRETNLSSGAKLELVAVSRSPVPVLVALQIEEERLKEMFPSDTSLWQILRIFESKDKMKYNFTESSWVESVKSGPGQLLYQQPIMNILGKEVTSLVELQKSLTQFGVNGGSVLIRFTLRKTARTFAEAAAEIDEYFKEVTVTDTDEPMPDAADIQPTTSTCETSNGIISVTEQAATESEAPREEQTVPEESEPIHKSPGHHAPPHRGIVPPKIFQAMAESKETSEKQKEVAYNSLQHIEKVHDARADVKSAQESCSQPETVKAAPEVAAPEKPATAKETDSIILGPNGRPVIITKAPSGDTPAAAQVPHDEMDYEPSQAHALSVLSRLQVESQNKRLLSDAEIERQEKEKIAKIAAAEISLKIRFPDQTTLTSKFYAGDTAGDLYNFVAGAIASQDAAFFLNIYGMGGIPRDEKKLMKDLKIATNAMVVFRWDNNVSDAARKTPVLRDEYHSKAIDIPLPEPAPVSGNQGSKAPAPKIAEKEGGKGKGLGAFKKFLPGGKK